MISIHAPREGRDISWPGWRISTCDFNPRAPRGARHLFGVFHVAVLVFQSTRPARGATPGFYPGRRCSSYFNPRAPRGARPWISDMGDRLEVFQSTRPARGATRVDAGRQGVQGISIHAPREGRDGGPAGGFGGAGISIHAPREGRDPDSGMIRHLSVAFQSTRPARGATLLQTGLSSISNRFQSTRPARGATGTSSLLGHFRHPFQSTRPARGATRRWQSGCCGRCHFNPRAPRGARQFKISPTKPSTSISIHAPREGRDSRCFPRLTPPRDFNPRAPRGARLWVTLSKFVPLGFQSTRPARGATWQIKPPAESGRYFNPRAPRGARLSGRSCQSPG